MSNRHTGRPFASGVTVVELMIVLVVVAVLAAIAWPNFQESIQRSRRADAMSALSEILQAQERWRANHPAYQDTLAKLPGARTVSHDQHYDLSLSNVSASGYTALASVRSGSPQAYDSACQVLSVKLDGGNIAYSSSAAASAATDPCWAR